MSDSAGAAPSDLRALIAVDLGAESCRVSLLRWPGGKPRITLVHRFENQVRFADGGLRWDLRMIEAGIDLGVRKAAEIASEGIRSIAVDGWAVDYVRLNENGRSLEDPYCYRDERTLRAAESVYERCSPERLRALTGVQQLRINTLYQLQADALAGVPERPWLNLPEYMLARWGGERVAELTNATHTQLVGLGRSAWCEEIFLALGLDSAMAPPIVPPGTIIGKLRGPLGEMPALHETVLIAPACHDTASAIAGIAASGDDWAYISSGTWSLVGAVLDQACNSAGACAENFTNLAAVGGRVCFHKNINGMWLLRQCIEQWSSEGLSESLLWTVPELVAAAERTTLPEGFIEVDDPSLLLKGNMPARINIQRAARGLAPLDEHPANAPQFALLIFHSLAARYAQVLARTAELSGRKFKRLFIVGGGSQNDLLNRLIAAETGLRVFRGAPESSTHGNFAIQLAALDGNTRPGIGVSAEAVAEWATKLECGH